MARSTGCVGRDSTRRASSPQSSMIRRAEAFASRRPARTSPASSSIGQRRMCWSPVFLGGRARPNSPISCRSARPPHSTAAANCCAGWTAVRGTSHFRMECRPAFNYARDSHEVTRAPAGVVFASAQLRLGLATSVPLRESDGARGGRLCFEGGRERGVRPARNERRDLRRVAVTGGGRGTLSRHRRVLASLDRTVPATRAAGARRCIDRHWRSSCSPTSRPARSWRRRRAACRKASAASATGTTDTPGSATRPSPSTRSCVSGSRTRPSASCISSARCAPPRGLTARCKSCTGLMGASTSPRRRSAILTAISARSRCALATAPMPSFSSTSTGNSSTRRISSTSTARRSRTRCGNRCVRWSIGCVTTGAARTRASGRCVAASSTSCTRS